MMLFILQLTSRLKKLNWYSNFRPLLAKSLGCKLLHVSLMSYFNCHAIVAAVTHRMVSHRLYKFIIGWSREICDHSLLFYDTLFFNFIGLIVFVNLIVLIVHANRIEGKYSL